MVHFNDISVSDVLPAHDIIVARRHAQLLRRKQSGRHGLRTIQDFRKTLDHPSIREECVDACLFLTASEWDTEAECAGGNITDCDAFS